MANDLTITAAVEWLDSLGYADSLPVRNLVVSVATERHIKTEQSIGFSATAAINLGAITSPAWAIFVNVDTTNYIELYTSTSGLVFAKLLAGELALLRLGSDAQAPAAKAHTAACVLHYFIASL